MAKIVILDDEKHCTDILQSLILRTGRENQIIATFNDPHKALQFIQKNEFDLLFLDIQMPKMNGFKLLDKVLPVQFDIIFTTAYDQYAIRAFEYSAINYLLKPISEKALINAFYSWEERKRKVNAEQWQLLRETLSNSKKEIDKIALPTSSGFEIVKLDTIVHCQSEDNYTIIFFKNGTKNVLPKTLKEIETKLSDHSFLRVHQSHLINPQYVKSISKGEGMSICMVDGTTIPVSRQNKKHISEILNSTLHFE